MRCNSVVLITAIVEAYALRAHPCVELRARQFNAAPLAELLVHLETLRFVLCLQAPLPSPTAPRSLGPAWERSKGQRDVCWWPPHPRTAALCWFLPRQATAPSTTLPGGRAPARGQGPGGRREARAFSLLLSFWPALPFLHHCPAPARLVVVERRPVRSPRVMWPRCAYRVLPRPFGYRSGAWRPVEGRGRGAAWGAGAHARRR